VKRKIQAILVALAITLGVVVAVQSPAAAAYSDCAAGQSCFWTGNSGTGARMDLPFSSYDPVGTCFNLYGIFQDSISSVKVGYGSGVTLDMFVNANCTGSAFLPPANSQHNLGGSFYDNKTTSFRLSN
jgi:hypothetical protein